MDEGVPREERRGLEKYATKFPGEEWRIATKMVVKRWGKEAGLKEKRKVLKSYCPVATGSVFLFFLFPTPVALVCELSSLLFSSTSPTVLSHLATKISLISVRPPINVSTRDLPCFLFPLRFLWNNPFGGDSQYLVDATEANCHGNDRNVFTFTKLNSSDLRRWQQEKQWNISFFTSGMSS